MNLYADRIAAGEKLAELLKGRTFKDPLIMALPRGGVPVASVISEKLAIPFDVLVVGKINYPGHPGTGIGAMSEDGKTLMVGPFHHGDPRLHDVIIEEKEELRRKIDNYRHGKKLPSVEGKEIILVDDGLMTGVTAIAGAKFLKEQGASRVILVIPVAPPTDDRVLRKFIDEIICPHRPVNFSSIESWYDDYPEIDDDEVNEYLQSRNKLRPEKLL
jgi:putative phosphoribosyl transferase